MRSAPPRRRRRRTRPPVVRLLVAVLVTVLGLGVAALLHPGAVGVGVTGGGGKLAGLLRPRLLRPGPHGVVGLGDSVPSGAACGCTSYVSLVAGALAARRHTHEPVTNLAVPGQTSAGVLAQLSEQETLQALAGADVAIVTVGANDFDATVVDDEACADPQVPACFGDDLAALGQRLQQILLRTRAAMPPGAALVVTGYWNVFLDGQVGAARGASYVRNSDALTRAVNAVVATAARAARATYVDLYAPFKGGGGRDDTVLLAPDGDHPNSAGHRVIADAVLAALA